MGAHDIIGVLSDSQGLSASASAASENTIDMAVDNPQFGVGHPIFLCIRTEVAADYATQDETYIIALEIADNAAFNTNLRCLWAIVKNAAADPMDGDDVRLATAGAWILRQPLPYEVAQRHMRLYYTLGGTTSSITIGAWLEDVPQSDRVQVAVSPVGNP